MKKGAGVVQLRHQLQTLQDECLRLKRDNKDLKAENEILRAESLTDSLTGTLNMRGFLQNMEMRFVGVPMRLGEERRRRRRQPTDPVFGTLVAIDLSGFKGVNDRISRDSGDQLLNFIASTLKASVRDTDAVARWGGDEFVIFFHREDKKFAESRMELIHSHVKGITLGLSPEEIKAQVNRDFLVDFRHTTTGIDRKVDFKSLVKSMLDRLEHTGSDLRLAHLNHK